MNKRNNRNDFEIMLSLLNSCRQSRGITDMIYDTRLNYTQIKQHLSLALKYDLIQTNDKIYNITEKGLAILRIIGYGYSKEVIPELA